jgi:hypothetical protein
VICLISGLAHYGLNAQVPHSVDIALPSHVQVPQMDSLPIRVFWFSLHDVHQVYLDWSEYFVDNYAESLSS